MRMVSPGWIPGFSGVEGAAGIAGPSSTFCFGSADFGAGVSSGLPAGRGGGSANRLCFQKEDGDSGRYPAGTTDEGKGGGVCSGSGFGAGAGVAVASTGLVGSTGLGWHCSGSRSSLGKRDGMGGRGVAGSVGAGVASG